MTWHRRSLTTLLATSLVVAAASCGASGGSEADQSSTTAAGRTTTAGRPTTTTETAGGERGGMTCPAETDVAAVVGADVDRSVTTGGKGGTGVGYTWRGCAYRWDDADQKVSIDELQLTGDTVLDGSADGGLFEALRREAQDEAADHGFVQLDRYVDTYRDGAQVVSRQGPGVLFAELRPGEGNEDDTSETLTNELLTFLDTDPASTLDCNDGDIGAYLEDFTDSTVTSAVRHDGAIGVDEVSFETKGCEISFEDGTEVVFSIADDANWEAWVAAKSASGLNAAYTELSVEEHDAFDTGEELVVAEGESARPIRVTTDEVEGTPEELARLRVEVAELVV